MRSVFNILLLWWLLRDLKMSGQRMSRVFLVWWIFGYLNEFLLQFGILRGCWGVDWTVAHVLYWKVRQWLSKMIFEDHCSLVRFKRYLQSKLQKNRFENDFKTKRTTFTAIKYHATTTFNFRMTNLGHGCSVPHLLCYLKNIFNKKNESDIFTDTNCSINNWTLKFPSIRTY